MFCSQMYYYRQVKTDGTIATCCASSASYNMSLKEFNESKTLEYMKDSMGNGIWPDQCIICKEQEEKNITSMRQATLDVGKPDNPKCFDLRLSNKCNFGCRFCSSEFSSRIAKENKEDKAYGVMNKQSIDDIKSEIPHVESLYFSGGEPTIIPEVEELCEFCVENDYAKNIDLVFGTNASKINENLIEMSKHFKTIHWTVSIDGVGDLAEYIRYGTKWNEVDENVRYLCSLGHSIGVNTVVNSYNVHALESIFEYVEEIKGLSKTFFQWIYIANPPFSPLIYSDPSLLERLNTVYAKFPHDAVKELIDGFGRDRDTYDDFIGETKRLDAIRKQSYENIMGYSSSNGYVDVC